MITKLTSYICELENKIRDCDKINLSVSTATVGWHIEHSLITICKITEAVINSKPENYKWEFNISRMIVHGISKIPRGRGKAPEIVVPQGLISEDSLRKNIIKTKQKIKDLKELKPDNFFKHPYFGNLNLKATIKFMEIHTKHHSDIADDIIKK